MWYLNKGLAGTVYDKSSFLTTSDNCNYLADVEDEDEERGFAIRLNFVPNIIKGEEFQPPPLQYYNEFYVQVMYVIKQVSQSPPSMKCLLESEYESLLNLFKCYIT